MNLQDFMFPIGYIVTAFLIVALLDNTGPEIKLTGLVSDKNGF